MRLKCEWQAGHLTELERKRLTIYLHKGAVGEFDFDGLANNFDVPLLLSSGFEKVELGLADFYTPETTPAIGSVSVTDQDIEVKARELGDKFSDGQDLVDVACPYCGEEFGVRRSDLVKSR